MNPVATILRVANSLQNGEKPTRDPITGLCQTASDLRRAAALFEELIEEADRCCGSVGDLADLRAILKRIGPAT